MRRPAAKCPSVSVSVTLSLYLSLSDSRSRTVQYMTIWRSRFNNSAGRQLDRQEQTGRQGCRHEGREEANTEEHGGFTRVTRGAHRGHGTRRDTIIMGITGSHGAGESRGSGSRAGITETTINTENTDITGGVMGQVGRGPRRDTLGHGRTHEGSRGHDEVTRTKDDTEGHGIHWRKKADHGDLRDHRRSKTLKRQGLHWLTTAAPRMRTLFDKVLLKKKVQNEWV